MSGFSTETVAFLAELRANNRRDWFEANRDLYLRAVRDAARDFAAALERELERSHGLPHQRKIYRINRDLRFSKDKSPYNTHVHMSFWPTRAETAGPAWMLGLEPEKLTVGAGIMAFSPRQLHHWRDSVNGPEGADLSRRLSGLVAGGARLPEPELARPPSPFARDHPRSGLLRRKGLTVWRNINEPQRAFGADGPRNCSQALLEFRPVVEWLETHVAAR